MPPERKPDQKESKHAARRPRAARLSRPERAATLRAAALHMLAEHGIGHTNHSLVAEAAGVSVQTAFFYYRTHAALTAVVLDHIATRILGEIVRPGTTEHDDPMEAIEWMLLRFARFIDTAPDPARVWLDWSTAIRSGTWPSYLAFLDRARELISEMLVRSQATGAIAPGIAVNDTTEVIIGLAHMVGHMKFTNVPDNRIARTIGCLVAGYFGATRRALAEGIGTHGTW